MKRKKRVDSHSEHTEAYKKAIESPHWKMLRRRKLGASGQFGYCERCNRFELAKNLELHHKHYNTLGRETTDDVELLCPKCHKLADEMRIVDTVFERGLKTYATKKYGEDWCDRVDPDTIAEEFEDWRDKHDDW